MDASQSVTLSGRVLEGTVAETAWPRVAALLHMSGEDFTARVQPRLPLTLKATTVESAQRQQQVLRQIGIEAVALSADGPCALLRNGVAVFGPVSSAWLRHALDTGEVYPGAEVRSDDASEWQRADVWLATGGARLDLDDAPASSAQDHVDATTAQPGADATQANAVPSPDADLLPTQQARPLLHAGSWRRSAAWLIDALIAGSAAYALFFTGMLPDLIVRSTGSVMFGHVSTWSGTFILRWLYAALFQSSRLQASPGMLALGLRVTDLRGARIGFARATGRYFASILSSILLGIGYLMIGWTRRKQGLHDLIAGTLVVRSRALQAYRQDPPSASPVQSASAAT